MAQHFVQNLDDLYYTCITRVRIKGVPMVKLLEGSVLQRSIVRAALKDTAFVDAMVRSGALSRNSNFTSDEGVISATDALLLHSRLACIRERN